MPNVERIDSIYNIPAISGEHEQLQKLLQQDASAIVQLYENLETFQGKSNVSTVTKNWENVSMAMTGAAEASGALAQMQAQLNAQIIKQAELEKQLADAIAKGTTARKSNKDLTDEEIRQKYEDSQATKNRVKEIIAETDAYKKLDLQRGQAAERAKTLQAQARESNDPNIKGQADAASAEAKKFADALKAIDYGVGEQKRLIGDYTGALKVLENELGEVNSQIAAMDKARAAGGPNVQNIGAGGAIGFNTARHAGGTTDSAAPTGPTNSAMGFDPARYKELTTQAAALNTVIGTQGKGFASTTMEIRAAERSLRTLHAAGLENTQGFKDLQKSTADAAREQRNFSESQKLLEDNVPILKSITIAAKGLAAGYAISQGAVALFSNGNEKLEKELNKLVAIMTILQGLQEVHELLEKSNAIASIFKNATTAAGSVILGVNTKETIANAEANVMQAKATLASATSQEEAMVAAEALATAEGEVAVATEAAAGATGTLVTVLGATGIGLILIAVAAAIIFLVTKMKEWTAATELDVKQQKDLNDSLTEQIDTLGKLNEIRTEAGQGALDDLREQLALEEKSGKNQYMILALKEKIADKNSDIANSNYAQALAKAEDKYVKEGLTGVAALHKAQSDYFDDLTDKTTKVGVVQHELSGVLHMTDEQRVDANISDKDVEGIRDRLELAKSEQKLAEAFYHYFVSTEKQKTDTANEQAQIRVEKEKLAIDEERKYLLETTKLEANDRKEANDRILSDIRSTLSERIKAVQSSAEQERRIANATFAEASAKFKAGETTPTEFKEAQNVHGSSIRNINADEKTKVRDTTYSYYVRDRDAAAEIYKLEQQDRQNNAQKVLADEKATFAQRQMAQGQNYEAQRQILGAEFLRDIDQLGMTNEEKLKLATKYNTDLLKLNIDYEKTQQEEQKAEKAKQLQQLEQFYKKQKDIQTQGQAEAGVKLNEQYNDHSIGTGEFERKKEDQGYNNQVANAQTNVKEAYGNTLQYKQGTQERQDAEAKLAQSQMALSDLVTNHQLDNQKKSEDLQIEAGKAVAESFVSVMGSAWDSQIQHIEKAMAKEEKYKNVQTQRIQSSTLGEQQKAAAVEVVNRQVQENQEALEKRERNIKARQARFNRDAAVAETVEQGSIAAIAALKIPIYGEAEAIAIGIITAAKVAEILAKPLPSYGFGTEDHIGGRAVVGDFFEKEYIKEPGKSGYWSPAVPTVINLAKHATVTPLAEMQRMASDNMFINERGVLIVERKDNSAKVLAQAISKQTDRLEKAIGRSRKTTIVNNHIDTNWGKYLEKNVYR